MFATILIPLLILGACVYALFAAIWSIISSFTSLPKPTIRTLGFGVLAAAIALCLEALVLLPFVIADVSVSVEEILLWFVGTCLLTVFFGIAGACFAHKRAPRHED